MKVLEKNIDKNHMKVIWKILYRMEKKVIKLKHGFEGPEYSFAEIGEILNISKQSAFQYYKQGINAIKKMLKDAA